MNRRFFHILCSLSIALQFSPMSLAASQPELNFKIYSPQDSAAASSSNSDAKPPAETKTEPKADDTNQVDSLWNTDSSSASSTPPSSSSDAASSSGSDSTSASAPAATSSETPAVDPVASSETKPTEEGQDGKKKLLQGYIRVVPSGTKIPIIMDTAIDTETSQEGDEFAARTGEDLNIDGSTVVPAGSVIKGRIAQLNSPKNLGRSGSVALKFDTVTTPDNRQIPLVANLVARGGVVHARRGLKDIAIDTGTFVLPAAIGIGIGALAGGAASNSSSSSGSSSLGRGGGALIGAGVGAGVGLIILAVKKGKKVDVRPGDELKIELAEDLRMPM